jgi:ABC-2 type transport system ATP-binding protein
MKEDDTMSNAIEIETLRVEFKTRKGIVRAVDDLSFSVKAGSVFGFLGANGAGKTTVMHVLLGFIRATAGRVSVLGNPAASVDTRGRIGFLPEHPDTYRFLTGRESLLYCGQLFGFDLATARLRASQLLSLAGLDGNAADRRIQTYSRGMMQKICLAQALVNDPDILLLDEPTGGLDPVARLQVRDIIRNLQERGKTVFFSSHELSEVEMVCDTVCILAEGRLVVIGTPRSLTGRDESLEQFFVKTVTTGRTPC